MGFYGFLKKKGNQVYKITWDKEINGVLLHSRIVPEVLGTSPRPVFFEELDLLGLDKLGWKYPHCEEPLLWAINKQYYYKGELVFEAKGANIYDAATVMLQPAGEHLELEPIDIEAMLYRNKDMMFLLESEAIEFIHETYEQYARARKTIQAASANTLDFEALAQKAEKKTKKKMAIVKEDCDSFDIMPLEDANNAGKRVYQTTKIDKFIASFSGGKDSQVVLDLCTRAIPSTDFEVIYSDTGYELPPSLELYDKIQEQYKEKFPDLKFSLARNHDSVLNYWDKIGTPSDTHRWCCSVMKTAPLYRMLRSGSDKLAKILTFDGVRAEESVRRSTYNRIGKGVKHNNVINASPILRWNSVEIFLYLFERQLYINPSYRRGMTRVGCLICPFSSEWNDMVSSRCYKESLSPFLTRIIDKAKNAGISDVDDYVKEGKWKLRAGGRDMKFPSSMKIKETKPNLEIEVVNPQKDIMTWLNAVGKYQTTVDADGNISGELSFENKIFNFTIKNKGNIIKIVFINTQMFPKLQGFIKRAFYKATYCVDCETCEVECPTGALQILPSVNLDRNKCISCHKCLTFHDYGCIAAASLAITGRKSNNNIMKLISYNNFGLNGEWMDFFFYNYSDYFTENSHGLNVKEQLPNFVKWLVQAEILKDSKSKQTTELGELLAVNYPDMPDLVWQIIWINLSYNSPIASWFKKNVKWTEVISQKEIEERVLADYSDNSKTTVHNVVYALFRTFKESPIGEAGQLVPIDKTMYRHESYTSVEREAVVYSLYKYCEAKGIHSLRVSDLYASDNSKGLYKEFGISKSELLSVLRSLNSDSNRLVIAELNMGLDNITIREDLTPVEALAMMIKL